MKKVDFHFLSPRCFYIGGFFLYLLLGYNKKNKKYSINIWLIKKVNLHLNSKPKKMKQSTKDTITVTIIIILALLGDSLFNQI